MIILEEYYQEFFNGCVEITIFYSKHSSMHTLKDDLFFFNIYNVLSAKKQAMASDPVEFNESYLRTSSSVL